MERRFLLTIMLNPGVKGFRGFGEINLCDETKMGKAIADARWRAANKRRKLTICAVHNNYAGA